MVTSVQDYEEYLRLWHARLLWWRNREGHLFPILWDVGLRLGRYVPLSREDFEWDLSQGYAYCVVTEE